MPYASKRTLRAVLVLGVSAATAALGACTLNPQPLPPAEFSSAADVEAGASSDGGRVTPGTPQSDAGDAGDAGDADGSEGDAGLVSDSGDAGDGG